MFLYLYITIMARSSKKDSIESVSNTKWIDKAKAKISWPEELWNWVSSIVKWTTDTLFNTLAATYEATMTWASFLSEKLWSKKPEIRENRKAIRKHHEERYKKLHDLVKDDLVFKRDEEIYWTCTKCGYVWKGKEPPKVCPLCGHDQGYYVKMNEDF